MTSWDGGAVRTRSAMRVALIATPDTARSTCCDRGHVRCRGSRHGEGGTARLRGHASRHCWRDTPGLRGVA